MSMTITSKRGFSLVELLVAMTLGLFLMGGVVALVSRATRTSTSSQSLQRLQESGRYAMSRVVADLRMTGGQYCSNYSNEYPFNGINRFRSFLVYADGAMPWGLPTRAAIVGSTETATPATEPYPLSPRFFIQGHECTTTAACDPVLNVVGGAVPAPPNAGTAAGNRAQAADVLTIRYMNSLGVPIVTSGYPGAGAPIQLNPNYSTSAAGVPLLFAAGDLALITDCSSSMVFEATYAGNSVTPSDTNDGGATRNDLRVFNSNSDARVFNFSKDFVNITYFLQLRADPNQTGRNISSLVRQVNGDVQLIADGVERLEFRYMVETAAGMRAMTAAEVQSAGSGLCTRQPMYNRAQEVGCLWRGVKAIEVAMLINSVDNNAPSETERYSFTFADQNEVAPPATLPSGLPRGRVFRREFRTTVSLRNFGL